MGLFSLPPPLFFFFSSTVAKTSGGGFKISQIGGGISLGGGGQKDPRGGVGFFMASFFSRNNMWEMPCGGAGVPPPSSQFVVLLCPLLPFCFLEEGEGSEKSTLVEKRRGKGEEGAIYFLLLAWLFLLAREMTYIFIARLAPPPLHFLPSSAAELHFLVSHKKGRKWLFFFFPLFSLSYPRSYLEL